MTIDSLFSALRASGSSLYVDAGRLRYAGPALAADSPIRAALAEHKPLLVELFTFAAAGRCPEPHCYRLPGHDGEHLLLDTPAGRIGTGEVAA